MMDNRDRIIEEMSNWTPEEVATAFAKWISEDEAGEVCDAYGIEKNENDEEEQKDDLLCPLGGDETNDCEDCAYCLDYHFVNGDCVRRELTEEQLAYNQTTEDEEIRESLKK